MRALMLIPLMLAALVFVPVGQAPAAALPIESVSVYQRDAHTAARALTRVGKELQRVKSASHLKRRATVIRRDLRVFDRHVFVLSRYQLEDATLNRQRRQLAATGPAVTDVLSLFLDATLMEQKRRVQALLPRVLRSLERFSRAATDFD